MKVDIDLEIEVALVPVVGPHAEEARDFFALLSRDIVLKVENSLLPVGVRRLRSSRETHALVTLGELNVEERD